MITVKAHSKLSPFTSIQEVDDLLYLSANAYAICKYQLRSRISRLKFVSLSLLEEKTDDEITTFILKIYNSKVKDSIIKQFGGKKEKDSSLMLPSIPKTTQKEDDLSLVMPSIPKVANHSDYLMETLKGNHTSKAGDGGTPNQAEIDAYEKATEENDIAKMAAQILSILNKYKFKTPLRKVKVEELLKSNVSAVYKSFMKVAAYLAEHPEAIQTDDLFLNKKVKKEIEALFA